MAKFRKGDHINLYRYSCGISVRLFKRRAYRTPNNKPYGVVLEVNYGNEPSTILIQYANGGTWYLKDYDCTLVFSKKLSVLDDIRTSDFIQGGI